MIYIKKICGYSANKYDSQILYNLCWRVGVDWRIDGVTEYVEEKGGREAFEKLLKDIEKGDIVFITTIAALSDGTYYSIIKKIRQLSGRKVILKVEDDTSFSYGSYEKWYSQKMKIDNAIDQFNKDCHRE